MPGRYTLQMTSLAAIAAPDAAAAAAVDHDAPARTLQL